MTESSTELPITHVRHYEHIKHSMPALLIDASPEERATFKQFHPQIPDWYRASTQAQKDQLKALHTALAVSKKKIKSTLERVPEINNFAQPLLEQALKDLGFTLPVNDVYVRLHIPAVDAFGLDAGGFNTQTMSLLQAALHNFEAPESQANYFGEASGFITQPDKYGRFQPYETALKVEVFTAVCRTLDIGTQYQKILEDYLNPSSALSQEVLRLRYLTHQKDRLKADAQLALMKGDIDASTHALMMRVVSGERAIKTGKQQLWYRYLSVADLVLKGCVVFSLGVEREYAGALIVWLPGDPEHPLKRYEHYGHFRDELIRKLTAKPSATRQSALTPYQQFLSGFIRQEDRPHYYKRLTVPVKYAPEQPAYLEWFHSEKTQWWARALLPPLALLPAVSPNPKGYTGRVLPEHLSLNVEICSMSGDHIWVDVDIWDRLFNDMRSRAFSNARSLAVPTSDADINNRAKRLSHYLNIGLFGANLIGMAIPVLGTVMMAVMAGQLLYETVEGIAEWGEGDKEAAWLHISDVLENIAMLAAGAVAMHVAVVPVIEKLKLITLPGGAKRLWNADMRPYEWPIEIPPDAQLNEQRLYQLKKQTVLRHEGKAYVVEKDAVTEQYRAVHPTRPDAYRPVFKNNGHGVWVHEAEQPVTWDRPTLKRRLGDLARGISDEQFEQIMKASDVLDDDLRRMYAENEPPPMLLTENLCQFKAYNKAMEAVSEVQSGRISSELCSYAATFSVELPSWPATTAVELYDPLRPQSSATRYGNESASSADTIRVSRQDLMNGKLPERVVDALSPSQLLGLLGERMPIEREGRIGLFKELLVAQMENNTRRLFTSLHEDVLSKTDPERPAIEQIKRVFQKLPTSIAHRLVIEASTVELQSLKQGKVPSDIMQKAVKLQREARLSAAYRGLYQDAMLTTDAEMLMLNTLEKLPGWQGDLRLEVHEHAFNGTLRSSAGSLNKASRKVLVRVADGVYQAFDAQGNQLHGNDNFCNSLQHALPDVYRKALGLPHVWQGNELKQALQQHALGREQLRPLLNIKAQSRAFFLPPERLQDGRLGYPLSGRGARASATTLRETFSARLKQLYPQLTDGGVEDFLMQYGVNAGARITALEEQYVALDTTLSTWVLSAVDGQTVNGSLTDAQRNALNVRSAIRNRLVEVWRRLRSEHSDNRGRSLGQALSFNHPEAGPLLESLPPLPADFSHVSLLDVSSSNVTDGIDGFLSHFSSLRSLSLDNNQLTRLPDSIGRMPHLTELYLASNQIVLTPEAVGRLRGLTNMELMTFESNFIGLLPDIARMPNLRVLNLSNCEVESWPTGLLAHPRPRRFSLFLESNPLTQIPEVAPGSDKANILARTTLTRSSVSDEVLKQYTLYCESVGIDPERERPPGLELGSAPWISGVGEPERVAKQALWNRVEQEVGAEPFFDMVSDQAQYLSGRPYAFIKDMTSKVWRMLEAIDENPTLRDKIFEMASAPYTCVDAGAQVFNALGVEVLLHEAYAAPRPWLVKLEVLDLARGKARLDELGRIARARVAELEALGRKHPEYDSEGNYIPHYDALGQQMQDIDEVEIYLVYTTELADRLNLPWQSPSMMFTVPDVTEAMIDNAYLRVRALEQGEGMRNQLLEQPMWLELIEGSNRSMFDGLQAKIDALSDLQQAQRDWAEGEDLTASEKASLRTEIENAARILGTDPHAVAPGKVMSDEAYDAQILAFSVEKQRLLETLTDEALGKTPTPDLQADDPNTGLTDITRL